LIMQSDSRDFFFSSHPYSAYSYSCPGLRLLLRSSLA
jgi:hypothetical protein